MKNKVIIVLLLMVTIPFINIYAQTVTVKGVVYDDAGETLPGASVMEVGNATNGVLTGLDGEFELRVRSANAEIQISFLGFETQKVKVNTRGRMDIHMEMSINSNILNETVIVGYGKQKAITNTGAVGSISAKEIAQTPSASIQNALVGKLPGLFQQQTSGQPGADAANVYIRGISTFANVSKTPLVLIDDIETDYTTLSQMDANEVENISILKDAASTAIYGVKGANGVILVSTKRGSVVSKPKITYKMEYGIQKPTVHNEVLGSYDALMVLREYYTNAFPGSDPKDQLGFLDPVALEHYRTGDSPYLYPDVNWYDAVMRSSAPQIRHNIDVTGGTESVKYFASFGYYNQEGILKEMKRSEDFDGNYYLRRYNLRTNLDIQATKTTKFSVSLSAILNEKNELHNTDPRPSGGAWNFWTTLASGRLPSYVYPIKYETGEYGGMGGYSTNPVMRLEYAGYRRQFKNNIVGNITVDQKLDFLLKGLAVRGTMALTNTWGYNRSLTRDEFPDFTYNPVSGAIERVMPTKDPLPPLTVNTSTTTAPYISPLRKITSQLILTYNQKFATNHDVSFLGLANWDTSKLGSGDPENFQGFSGRLTYSFRNTYMLEFNVGYNGSDRFKAKNKYGTFPAVSGGWNISEEPFLKDFFKKIHVDYFKIRGSYGLVGSDAFSSSNRYLYAGTYNSNTTANYTYYFGETPTGIGSIWPGQLANDDVRWEKDKKLDIGADLRLFNNRMTLGFDYFKNERYDILTTRNTIPALTGVTSPPVNIGRVSNKGFEIEGGWRDRVGNDASYWLKGNISVARNKILERDEAMSQYPLQRLTGRPVGQIFGFIHDGYYQNEEEIAALPDLLRTTVKPGDLKYRDISGPSGKPDGVIDAYDRGPIGKPNVPQVTYGFSVGGTYKGFDFSVLFQGAADGSIMSSTILQVGNENGRPRKIHQDAWREDNRNAAFPRLGGPNFDNSTFWLRSNAYLRLKNVEVGYTFHPEMLKRYKISSLRVFANGLNLVTWSDLGIYDVDPESASGTNSAYANYPQMKVFNFGVQVSF